MTEGQVHDAAEREMDLYRAEVDRLSEASDRMRQLADRRAEVLAEVFAFLGDGIPPGDEFAIQVNAWRERAGMPA